MASRLFRRKPSFRIQTFQGMPVAVKGEAFVSLSHEATELYLPKQVPRLPCPPSPLTFLRNYVMPNIPVVIENGISHWPALTKWTQEYLRSIIGDKIVTVATTPNGYADATVGDRFVLPHESQVTFADFLKKLELSKSGDEIVYIQNQNSSFLEEFRELLPDAAEDIPWASEALGKQPDAVNFWMGGSRSVTSMHKDHYENLYGVVAGSKTFILHPPTDLPCIPYEEYRVGRYARNPKTGKLEIVDEVNQEQCEDCKGLQRIAKDCEDCEDAIKILVPDDPSKKEDGRKNEGPGLLESPAHMTSNGLSNGGDISFSGVESRKNFNTVHADVQHCSCRQACTVPWIAIDPLCPDLKTYPSYKHTHQLTVTLAPGDLLYLPSLWFHHVQQSDNTIAVNYWYDMEYDIKYAYYKFVEDLIRQGKDKN